MRLLVLTAIYPRPGRPDFGSFVRTQVVALQNAGLDVDVLVLDGRRRKLIYPKGVVELRRRISAHPPDLVHAHYSYVGAVARTQRHVPIVLTYHGSDILGSVNTRGHRLPAGRLIAAGGSLLGEFVDAVIVQSAEMAAHFRRRDVHVIPHEIDFETFTPTDRLQARAELRLDPDRPYALFAASPAKAVKNFALADRAVEIARRTLPDLEMVVVHCEPQARLALFMSACDVLAFSSWQEGSPNVVKQAMACGMPIVSTDVGDVRSLIAATHGCHVVPTEAEPFATALLSAATLRRRTAGRAAVAHLASGRVSQQLIAVYDDVLAGGSAGPSSSPRAT